MNKHLFYILNDGIDQRIDHFLVDKLEGISRTRIQKLISSGFITVNGDDIKANYRLKETDEIEAYIPRFKQFKLLSENIPLDIKFEDDYLLVINKPAGMVVHPAVGNWSGTLLNGLLYHLEQAGNIKRKPGLVHRLDKETSGLLIAAKDENTLNFMQNELKERRIKRFYEAFVWGHMREESGKIELPIGRSPTNRMFMAVTDHNSRPAITKYELKTRFKFCDHVWVSLQTGRTHQIRVHFSHLGHPVVGDRDYGGDEKIFPGLFDLYRNQARRIIDMVPRQCLHASKLEFKHPKTGLIHSIKSDFPDDMQSVIDYLNRIESDA